MGDVGVAVLPGTSVECETNRGKPQQSCLVQVQQAIHSILCTSLGLADKLEGTQMCVQLFFFLSTPVFLCSSYHEKQPILSLSRILTWWITMLLRINLSAHPPPPAPSANRHMEKEISQ